MDCNIKRFYAYRPHITPDTHSDDMMNAPDEIQFEGVVLTTGKVVIQWRTAIESLCVFDSMDQFMKIHGHPEYGTTIHWMDQKQENLRNGRLPNCS